MSAIETDIPLLPMQEFVSPGEKTKSSLFHCSFTSSFILAGILLVIGAGLTMTLRSAEKSNMALAENGLKEAA